METRLRASPWRACSSRRQAYAVVVLPLPAGPVIKTAPADSCNKSDNAPAKSSGNPRSARRSKRASEVKSLAHQTSKATEEISSHVASIQGITAETRGAIDAISKTLSEISAIMSGIEVDTAQQRTATQEIASSVQGAARGTLDVSNHITQITSTSAETGRMASEARDSAVELSQQAETLKREVDEFIRSVRAS